MKWQPIETAPKDGSVFLAWFPWYGGNVEKCRWDTQRFAKRPNPYFAPDSERWLGVRPARENQPTHWMPLPDPPNAG